MKQHSTSIKKQTIVNCQLSIAHFSIILFLFFASPLKSQVTIGSLDPPQPFSILELTTKNHDGGLRLPLLSTEERDNLNLKDLVDPEAEAAEGLVIFNTTTNCLEFWNGEKWISMCSDVMPDCSATVFPVLGRSYTFCTGATFADLTASVGGKELWYDAETGGAAHADGDPLVSGTYYAEEFVGACVSPTRTPVSVTLGDYCSPIKSGAVTTFTNVMYDFQQQTLEAYSTDGGLPTTYQWQISENNVAFNDITDAPNSNFYTVPPHFADSYANAGTTGLYFRCILSNSKGSTTTSSLNILFITTETTAGTPVGNYGIDPVTDIRYLTIQKGAGGNNTPTTSGTIKIALLNLGQSEDNGIYNNDAGDLGDFYQWGRVKDGHEHIVWSKDPSTRAKSGDGSSDYRPGPASAADLDPANGQILPTSTLSGNFITSSTSYWDNGNNKLWGNGGTYTRAGSDIPLSSWTYVNDQVNNNPCPGTWSVPSVWNFWDISNGDGSTTLSTLDFSGGVFNGVNTWQWRGTTTNNAIGGAIITNSNGEKVFLPAAGVRNSDSALSNSAGEVGRYWGSSVSGQYASSLGFSSNYVSPAINIPYSRASGFSVRCVSE